MEVGTYSLDENQSTIVRHSSTTVPPTSQVEPQESLRSSQQRAGNDSVFRAAGESLQIVYEDLSYRVTFSKSERKKMAKDAKREQAEQAGEKTPQPPPPPPEHKEILTKMTGLFQPGRLTAILGASGAGKTTLLNVMAGQVTEGEVSGQVRVNGEDFRERMREISGFVFQDDVILPTMRVQEAIKMSALLRLPKQVTKEERRRRVKEVIHMLNLEKAASTIVGTTLTKGISGGERKRTSIAMEIITNPAMLFLDEPTSGLDTFTAYSVVSLLADLAHQQSRTVVATIHQPSSEMYRLFDDLLILAEGRIMYYGTAEHAIEYFGGLGYPCPQYSNPADYFFMRILRDIDRLAGGQQMTEAGVATTEALDETGETSKERIKRLLDYWPTSPEAQSLGQDIAAGSRAGVTNRSLRTMAPWGRQFRYLLGRASLNAIRNPMMVRVKLFQSIFVGVLLGLVYYRINDTPVEAQIQSKAGILFFLCVNQFFGSSNAVLATFSVEKPVFIREYTAGYYKLSSYYLSKTLVELPYQFIFPFLLVIIFYYWIGLNPPFSAYLMAALLASLCGICGVGLGMLIGSIFDDISVALAVFPVIVLPLFLFSGLFANNDTLPGWLAWIKYLSPLQYAFTGLLQNEFSRPFPNCRGGPVFCSGERALVQLGVNNALPLGVNIVFLILFYLVFTVGAYLVLAWRVRKLTPRTKKE